MTASFLITGEVILLGLLFLLGEADLIELLAMTGTLEPQLARKGKIATAARLKNWDNLMRILLPESCFYCDRDR